MKQLVILLAVTAVACGSWTGGLRVRFDVGVGIGSDFFYDVPRTASAAREEGWSKTSRPDGPLNTLELYCPESRTLCVFYDDTEYVAGLQVALNVDLFTHAVLNWETQGYTKWTPGSDGKTYWTLQQYFVNEEFLARTAEDRVAARNSDKVLQQDGIWVTGTNRQLLKISNSTDGIASSIFTQQACIPWMGRHFYYNMTEDTECTSEGMYPWFPLVDSGELVGTGFIVVGQLPVDETRDWFERPPKAAVEAIVPRGPECLYEMAEQQGLVTMHIYYVEKPWLITCLFQ